MVPADLRKRYATVRTGGKDKFPVYNERTARSAKRLENNAKPALTPMQKLAVNRAAAKFGA